MAEHAGSPELTDPAATASERPEAGLWTGKLRRAATLWTLSAFTLASLGGWLGFSLLQERRAETQRNQFVEAARQGVLNLATIGYETAEDDVRRILDSSTGAFHDDFDERSKPFIEVIKKAQSKSEGTITAAGLESQDGDQAKVLVVAAVRMTDPVAKESPPAVWRMRISVTRSGDVMKMSEVQFVP